MLGLKIFMATFLFFPESLIVAKCTCAIDAAATGSEFQSISMMYTPQTTP